MHAIGALSLPAYLDLTVAAKLQQQFLALRGDDLHIDAGRLERIGGLGLQVLLAAQSCWKADGHRFAVMHLSREAEAGFTLLGVPAGAFSDGEG